MTLRRAGVGAIVLAAISAACESFGDAPAAADGGVGSGTIEAGGGDGAAADGDVTGPDGGGPQTDAGGDGQILRAFVTATGYTDVTTAATADSKCTAEATGRLSGKFVAWYPDVLEGKSAPARLVRSDGGAVDGPWYRVDGVLVASSRDALSRTGTVPLGAPISIGAAGTMVGGSVWTGTTADGGIGAVCPAGLPPTSGSASQTGPAWTQQTFFTATCDSSLGLYCFQVE